MKWNRRRSALLAFPVALLLFYEVFVLVSVIWDPKFGGPWDTVEFMQGIGILVVGVPSLLYVLGIVLLRRPLRAFSAAQIAVTGVAAATTLIVLLFAMG